MTVYVIGVLRNRKRNLYRWSFVTNKRGGKLLSVINKCQLSGNQS